jgi:hypothetical protein
MLSHVGTSITHLVTIAVSGTPQGRNSSVWHPASFGATREASSIEMDGQPSTSAPASPPSVVSPARVSQPVVATAAAASAIRRNALPRRPSDPLTTLSPASHARP